MNTFWKLNVISGLYALLFFIPIELYVNVLRFSRLTGGEFKVVAKIIGGSAVTIIILLSAVIFYLTKKWMSSRKSSYWSLLLWLPYQILFILIYSSFFPITNPLDKGGPGDGLLILGLLFLHPFYILLLNTFSIFISDEKPS